MINKKDLIIRTLMTEVMTGFSIAIFELLILTSPAKLLALDPLIKLVLIAAIVGYYSYNLYLIFITYQDYDQL